MFVSCRTSTSCHTSARQSFPFLRFLTNLAANSFPVSLLTHRLTTAYWPLQVKKIIHCKCWINSIETTSFLQRYTSKWFESESDQLCVTFKAITKKTLPSDFIQNFIKNVKSFRSWLKLRHFDKNISILFNWTSPFDSAVVRQLITYRQLSLQFFFRSLSEYRIWIIPRVLNAWTNEISTNQIPSITIKLRLFFFSLSVTSAVPRKNSNFVRWFVRLYERFGLYKIFFWHCKFFFLKPPAANSSTIIWSTLKVHSFHTNRV